MTVLIHNFNTNHLFYQNLNTIFQFLGQFALRSIKIIFKKGVDNFETEHKKFLFLVMGAVPTISYYHDPNFNHWKILLKWFFKFSPKSKSWNMKWCKTKTGYLATISKLWKIICGNFLLQYGCFQCSSNSNPVSYWVTWQTNRELYIRTGQSVFTIFCFQKMFKLTKLVPKCFIMSVEHY